ncbi:MAG: ABC-F family ATP-binding cassette domain-containing protein [Saprospiraceae bacterium]|nr:ABC-F family ATP-binding cassette domain-containing protein [Saprospiraceae bacterium]MBK6563986.1 ABC-F family ATP-binding cassette domain-containing protein [Saprospiraceae bacterium]MBK8373027.1 ABC-F family ATP-binding cassette domain-containing protein [Saprospiraceae bacterium]MBP6694873.1 ABC-F family ATP-binding cassette domain-containing protein [Saprospiraceae bacterium]
MFYVRDIVVKFGDRTLLDGVSFMISPKERIGLIGRNGAGKSTLLKIMAGKQRPDEGKLEFPSKTTVGYLKQEFELDENKTVIEETLTCFSEALALQKRYEDIQTEMMAFEEYESKTYHDLVEEMSEVSNLLDHYNLASLQVNTIKILKGLGFQESEFERKVSELSGGWKMRIELAKLLLRSPDLLMLDEPTNHLDIESIIWLENYLQGYSGTVILISHDIQFLDNVCNRIIEIEVGNIIDMKLSYKKYLIEKERYRTVQQSAFENQQKEIAQKEKTISRFMAKATKTKMAQSMQKQLEKMDRIEVPAEINRSMRIRFSEVPRSGRDVIVANSVSKSFGQKHVLKDVHLTIERGDRVAFVGQNGQGKTTLAKILCDVLPADKGQVTKGSNVHLSYYAQNQSELLDVKRTILETMEDKTPEEARTKIRSVLGSFLFSGDEVEKKVSVLSGGERARLAMASLMMKPCNFLILDEPTNHLDIHSKEILKSALLEYEGTLLVISHDRDFLAGLTNKMYECKDGKVNEYLGDIEYFLQKKSFANMREIETSQPGQPNVPSSPETKNIVEGEEYRKAKKQIQQIERTIEKLENEIKVWEEKMAQPEFYSDPNHQNDMDKYHSLQENLAAKMEEWDQLVSILE